MWHVQRKFDDIFYTLECSTLDCSLVGMDHWQVVLWCSIFPGPALFSYSWPYLGIFMAICCPSLHGWMGRDRLAVTTVWETIFKGIILIYMLIEINCFSLHNLFEYHIWFSSWIHGMNGSVSPSVWVKSRID